MACAGLIDVDSTKIDGELTINGVLMHNPAFCATDVTPLWGEADERGEDLLIPGMWGQLALPKRPDKTTYPIPLVIDGSMNVAGVPWANVREGFRRNQLYIRQYISDKAVVGAAPVPVSLTSPDGLTTLTGSAWCKLTVGEKKKSIWFAVLDVTIPTPGYLV